MIQTMCRKCGNSYFKYNSLMTMCDKCRINKYTKPRKQLKKIGPVTKKWIETRRKWIELNPGPWNCYICGVPLDINEMELDHVKPRSKYPELRFDLDNLKPCCHKDNFEKGSK